MAFIRQIRTRLWRTLTKMIFQRQNEEKITEYKTSTEACVAERWLGLLEWLCQSTKVRSLNKRHKEAKIALNSTKSL